MDVERPETLKFGVGLGLLAVIAHTFVHYGFISISKMFEVGAIQSNIGIFAAAVVGMYGMDIAVEKLSGYKLFGAGFFLWLLHAIAHDGIHSFYISFDKIAEFGLFGVPESGMTVALIQAAGIIYIYLKNR
jgi:hypothetical protein